MGESLLSFSEVLLFGRLMDDLTVGNKASNGSDNGNNQPASRTDGGTGSSPDDNDDNGSGNKGPKDKRKGNNFLGKSLGKTIEGDRDPKFARIYGFSFEGTYYELPAPTLFLVDGIGDLVSEASNTAGDPEIDPSNPSRAPRSPEFGGLASSEFQFADDIRVWSYDKSDYTIRMDVATGMLEQVLLEPTFSDIDASVSGAKVSGAKVSGAKVSGAKVSGAKVSGAKVSGAKARGPSD